MKRALRNLGELASIWIVIGTVLFLLAWLVVPKLCETPEYDGRPVNVARRMT